MLKESYLRFLNINYVCKYICTKFEKEYGHRFTTVEIVIRKHQEDDGHNCLLFGEPWFDFCES